MNDHDGLGCAFPQRSAFAVIREQFLTGNSIEKLCQRLFPAAFAAS